MVADSWVLLFGWLFTVRDTCCSTRVVPLTLGERRCVLPVSVPPYYFLFTLRYMAYASDARYSTLRSWRADASCCYRGGVFGADLSYVGGYVARRLFWGCAISRTSLVEPRCKGIPSYVNFTLRALRMGALLTY